MGGFIRPGKPVEDEFIESFSGKPRDANLNANQVLPVDGASDVGACNTIDAFLGRLFKGSQENLHLSRLALEGGDVAPQSRQRHVARDFCTLRIGDRGWGDFG